MDTIELNGTVEMNERGEPRTGSDLQRWIGDLDHPFYSDERNRYVWYEASAIGFQLALIGSYLTAGLCLWMGGSAALLYVAVMMIPLLLAVFTFQRFLKRHSAEYWPAANDFRRPRGQLALGAYLLMATGLVRAILNVDGSSGDGSNVDSFVDGFGGGALVGLGLGAFIFGIFFGLRLRAQRAEAADD